MSNGFTFNGVHSRARYIKAVKAPRIIVPERKTEIVEIPFRTQPYILPDESYKSEVIPVDCWVDTENKSLHQIGRDWTRWLHTASWGNLVFDDDPTYTYKAMCITAITPDDLRSPVVTIEFVCYRPEVS